MKTTKSEMNQMLYYDLKNVHTVYESEFEWHNQIRNECIDCYYTNEYI